MRNNYTLLPAATSPSRQRSRSGIQKFCNHIRKSRTAFITISLITALGLAFVSYNHSPQRLEIPRSYVPTWSDGIFGVTASDNGSTALSAESTGWLTYMTANRGPRPAHDQFPTRSQQVISPACIDLWISQAEVCQELKDKKLKDATIDVAWSWVNASAPIWQAARTIYGSNTSHIDVNKVMTGLSAHHHRNHDQLRYSFRSVIQSFGLVRIGKLFFITADFPIVANSTRSFASNPVGALWSKLSQKQATYRVKQVPTWVKMEAPSQLEIVAPFDLFDVQASSHQELDRWKKTKLPIFNSLPIESQLGNLDAVSETLLYINDDMYVRHQFATSDISTTMLGPVYRIQRDLLVSGKNTSFTAIRKEGEWPSMEMSNWLLDQRFGKRERPYLIHVAKTLSLPLLREAQAIWPEEFKLTAESRFRGQNDELQPCFLAVHYVIEKQREALLWSLIVGSRLDANSDGMMDFDERQDLLQALVESSNTPNDSKNSMLTSMLRIRFPNRIPLNYRDVLAQLGVSLPERTTYVQTLLDGYAFGHTLRDFKYWPASFYNTTAKLPEITEPTPFACSIELKRCFGSQNFFSSPDDADTAELFKRVAFEFPDCGDCLLTAYMWSDQPTKGLENLLPRSSSSLLTTPFPSGAPLLGIGSKKWQHIDFSLKNVGQNWSRHGFVDARHFATTLLMRYNHVYGDSATVFTTMRDPNLLRSELQSKLKPGTETALIAINDDITNQDLVDATDKVLQEWHQTMWSNKTHFEL